jgi:YD repeat-containing protein
MLSSYLTDFAQSLQGFSTPPELLNKITPLSPAAASIGLYGDVPVSLYTGIPDISIPIYEIQVGSFKFPISLSYHASGMRVDDVASSVGASWSLNAGGVINRNLRGILDEKMIEGYKSSETRQAIETITSETASLAEKSNASNKLWGESFDTDSDIFTFNFPNGSGKFFLDPLGNYYFLPVKNKYKIEYSGKYTPSDFVSSNRYFFSRWVITDNNGVKYIYGKSLVDRSETIDAFEETCVENIQGNPCDANVSINSWFLDEIILANGVSIKVNYELFTYKLQNTLSHTAFFSGSSNCSGSSSSRGTLNYRRALRIKEIIYPNGKVQFNKGAERTDLLGDYLLNSIIIFYKRGSQYFEEKTYQLHYTNGNRLRLDKLVEVGANGLKGKAHSFLYDNLINLPPRGSQSQDLWGYYNGQPNSSLIPGFIETTPEGLRRLVIAEANRAVDSRFTKAGMLTQITYPTGGWSKFEYENNTVTCQGLGTENINLCNILDRTSQFPFVESSNNSYFFKETATSNDVGDEFSINSSNVRVEFRSIAGCPITQQGIFNCTDVKLQKKLGDGSFQTVISNLHTGSSYTVSDLGATYRVKVEWTPSAGIGIDIQVALYYIGEYISPQLDISKGERFSGGLRIKNISDYDPESNKTKVRSYNYRYSEDDVGNLKSKPSGVLMNIPINSYLYNSCYSGSTNTFCLNQIALSSNSQSNILSHDGISTGYRRVEEIIEGGRIGKSENYFTTALEYPDEGIEPSTGYPFPPTTSKEWKRGLREANTIRDKDNHLLMGENSYFAFASGNQVGKLNYKMIKCVKIFSLPSLEVGSGGGGCIFTSGYSVYSISTEDFYLAKMKSSQYNGNTTLIKTTDYVQDPESLENQETQTTNSKGQKMITYTRYATNYPNANSAVNDNAKGIKKLLEYNMLTVPIERIITVKNESNEEVVVNASIFTYYPDKPLANKMYQLQISEPIQFNSIAPQSFMPSSIDNTGNLVMDQRYKEMITYKAYDDTHNPIEIYKEANYLNSFLWGYNKQYPVAEIKNATYKEVINVLGQSVIDILNNDPGTDENVRQLLQPLRTHPNFRNAQVVTYTYQSLVGMTSMTDMNGKTMYYEYDGLGRLKIVRDHNNKIVKFLSYNYKKH